MKKVIRLTEQDLHGIIRESVNKILMTELDWKTYKNAAEKEFDRNGGQSWRGMEFNSASDRAFNRDVLGANGPYKDKHTTGRRFRGKGGERLEMHTTRNGLTTYPQYRYVKGYSPDNTLKQLKWNNNDGTYLETSRETWPDIYGYNSEWEVTKRPMTADEYFGDNDEAKEYWNKGKRELGNYLSGRYGTPDNPSYKNGKWHLKDED